MEAGLIRYPAAEIRQTLCATHNLEPVQCSDDRGAQPAPHDDFKCFSTHRDSFRIHETAVRPAAIDRTPYPLSYRRNGQAGHHVTQLKTGHPPCSFSASTKLEVIIPRG